MVNSVHLNTLSFALNNPVRTGNTASNANLNIKAHIEPAASISEVISTALHGITNEALAETQEEMSLVMGGKVRDGRRFSRDAGSRIEQRRNLHMLQRHVLGIENVAAVELEKLLEQFSDLADRHDPLAYLRQSGLDSGKMVLLLSALLSNQRLDKNQRRRLREALYQAMEDEAWTVSMFANLALGPTTPALFNQLKQLYQHAASGDRSLVKWFHQFREMNDREKKLKVVLRALAFELSAQRPSLRDNHLAAVIADLQRIILFFGLSDHCTQTACLLPWANLDGDAVLLEILVAIDQVWISADWLRTHYSARDFSEQQHYLFANRLAEIIKLLAEPCFRDSDQREMLCTAYAEYLDSLAAEENL